MSTRDSGASRGAGGARDSKRLPIRQRLAAAMFINPQIPYWVPELIIAGVEQDRDTIDRIWKEHIHCPDDMRPVAELCCEVFGESAVDRALQAEGIRKA